MNKANTAKLPTFVGKHVTELTAEVNNGSVRAQVLLYHGMCN